MTRSPARRPPTTRPRRSSLLADEWEQIVDRIRETIANDPVTLAGLAEAQAITTTQLDATGAATTSDRPLLTDAELDRVSQLWLTLTDRLVAPDKLGRFVPEETLRQIVWSLITLRPVGGRDDPPRFQELPSVPGRVVWWIFDDADVQGLRAAIEPGQVWVRADLVGSDEWPTVRAAAAINVQLAGGGGQPGRPRGRGGRDFAVIVAAVSARPDMTNAEIIELARPLWAKLKLADDYSSVRRRVQRIRKRAAEAAAGASS